jgi:hypothetical protein
MLNGTDLSFYNVVDYPAMHAAGIGFSINRTYSGSAVDSKFPVHTAGCKSVGDKTGSYFVGNYTRAAKGQASQMIALQRDTDIVPALDWERLPGTTFPNRARQLDWLEVFYAELEANYTEGNGDLLYINVSTLQSLRPVPDWLLRRKLWLAYPGTWTAAMIAPWKTVTVHQYKLDTTAPWAKSTIDLDSCDDLTAILKGVTPTPAPVFVPYDVKVTATALNIRSGPSTIYPVVSTAKYGEVQTILEINNGWGRITATTWICLSYTQRI